jgi:hypothetical protein
MPDFNCGGKVNAAVLLNNWNSLEGGETPLFEDKNQETETRKKRRNTTLRCYVGKWVPTRYVP